MLIVYDFTEVEHHMGSSLSQSAYGRNKAF